MNEARLPSDLTIRRQGEEIDRLLAVVTQGAKDRAALLERLQVTEGELAKRLGVEEKLRRAEERIAVLTR